VPSLAVEACVCLHGRRGLMRVLLAAAQESSPSLRDSRRLLPAVALFDSAAPVHSVLSVDCAACPAACRARQRMRCDASSLSRSVTPGSRPAPLRRCCVDAIALAMAPGCPMQCCAVLPVVTTAAATRSAGWRRPSPSHTPASLSLPVPGSVSTSRASVPAAGAPQQGGAGGGG
jgi:hypothetical protein